MAGSHITSSVFETCPQKVARLHIVTPVSKATKNDLQELAASFKWEFIQQWTIVFDTAQQHDLEPAFAHEPKAKEMFFQAEGIKGNSQRNRALVEIKQGLVHFLGERFGFGSQYRF